MSVEQATDQTGLATLDMTTLPAGINGEIAPLFLGQSGGFSNTASLVLTNNGLGYEGVLDYLNLPAGSDSNGNGIPDFFESSQSVSATTAGAYDIPGYGSGSVIAQWGRDTNSTIGTLRLTLQSGLVFTHIFQLLEYTGPLIYNPGSNTVTGTVNLSQTGAANQMNGSVRFAKTVDKYNQLNLLAGFWTNAAAQTLSYSNHLYVRDLTKSTNYSGLFEFFDYDKNTAAEDFFYWRLVITDLNDTDQDGIPDFSDDPSIGLPPRRPLLSLARTPSNLMLTIRGDVGHLHTVQEATAINSATWSNVLSVTLTNDPQTVTLPLPTVPLKFWRVLAQ